MALVGLGLVCLKESEVQAFAPFLYTTYRGGIKRIPLAAGSSHAREMK